MGRLGVFLPSYSMGFLFMEVSFNNESTVYPLDSELM
jgi:hypothetical protein